MTGKKSTTISNAFAGLFRKQIFIPIAALLLLTVFNLVIDPAFFKITLGTNSGGDPVLTGYVMTILDYGSEVAILAIGYGGFRRTGYQRRRGCGDRRFRDFASPRGTGRRRDA